MIRNRTLTNCKGFARVPPTPFQEEVLTVALPVDGRRSICVAGEWQAEEEEEEAEEEEEEEETEENEVAMPLFWLC